MTRNVGGKFCNRVANTKDTRSSDDATTTTTTKNFRQKRSVAQIKDQVVRIKTHTESSKSELSSKGKRPFKVSIYFTDDNNIDDKNICLLYTSPSPRDVEESRMPSSA